MIRPSLAEEADHTLFGVSAVDPLKTLGVEITFVERRFVAVGVVQSLHPFLNSGMGRVAEKVPIETLFMIPFPTLAEFAAHEEELLPRLAVHVPVDQSEVGELLPVVSGHFAEERSFAVHDLIMGKRKGEVLRKGIKHAEGQIVMLVFSMDRVMGHVGQRVVHPTHVPLEAETQAAQVGGPGDHGPGSGFLGDGLSIGEALIDGFVEGEIRDVLWQRIDRALDSISGGAT